MASEESFMVLVLLTCIIEACGWAKSSPASSARSQMHSFALSADAMYLASVVEVETVGCFLVHQDMSPEPRAQQ